MKSRSIRKLPILAGLAMVALVGMSSTARADIILTLVDSGNPGGSFGPSTIASGSPTAGGGAGISSTAFSGQFGDFLYSSALAGESQGGSPLTAEAVSTSLNIQNTTGATHTLTITIQDTGFTSPTAPPPVSLTSSFSGTTNNGLGSATFQSSVVTLGANSPGPQVVNPLGLSFNNTAFGTVTSTGVAPYSIFQTLTITLTAGEKINFTGRTDLVATPEPATLAMAAAALPVLGIGMFLRRRRRLATA
jgi:hypothetical protein